MHGCTKGDRRIRGESYLRWIMGWIPFLLLAASLAATGGLAFISSRNYPGGQAMRELHRLEVISDCGEWGGNGEGKGEGEGEGEGGEGKRREKEGRAGPT
jgi:hypothetical protein